MKSALGRAAFGCRLSSDGARHAKAALGQALQNERIRESRPCRGERLALLLPFARTLRPPHQHRRGARVCRGPARCWRHPFRHQSRCQGCRSPLPRLRKECRAGFPECKPPQRGLRPGTRRAVERSWLLTTSRVATPSARAACAEAVAFAWTADSAAGCRCANGAVSIAGRVIVLAAAAE